MATGRLDFVLRQLRHLIGARSDTAHADGVLLDRFLQNHDEEAFAILLQRHGPMVLGVCRRILGDAADVDDAFQRLRRPLRVCSRRVNRPDTSPAFRDRQSDGPRSPFPRRTAKPSFLRRTPGISRSARRRARRHRRPIGVGKPPCPTCGPDRSFCNEIGVIRALKSGCTRTLPIFNFAGYDAPSSPIRRAGIQPCPGFESPKSIGARSGSLWSNRARYRVSHTTASTTSAKNRYGCCAERSCHSRLSTCQMARRQGRRMARSARHSLNRSGRIFASRTPGSSAKIRRGQSPGCARQLMRARLSLGW
jgi:hypothetical protein